MSTRSARPDEAERLRTLYLAAVKRSLVGLNCRREIDLVPVEPGDVLAEQEWEPPPARARLVLAKETTVDVEARLSGLHRRVPPDGQTLIGLERLDDLEQKAATVIRDGIPGDFIETGAWRGGACILLRAVLEAYGERGRTVWVADSFRGLPVPSRAEDADSTLHLFDELAIAEDEVKANFELYGLLDEQVRFVPGWFRDTLPALSDQAWSLIRLDGDLFESTWDALANLYPRLSPGGFLVVDDYVTYTSCADAVDTYRAEHGITDPIVVIDYGAVYWRKS